MTITGNKFKPEFFFVSPLEVVKVTTENLQEVADWCGGKVATVESRKVKGRIDSYVWVPTPKGTQISWAFPGMFITKRLVVTLKNELKATYSVFRRDYFEKNYFNTPKDAVDATWERQAKMVERETPHSPLKEPRQAEKHEEEAESSVVEQIAPLIEEELAKIPADEQGIVVDENDENKAFGLFDREGNPSNDVDVPGTHYHAIPEETCDTTCPYNVNFEEESSALDRVLLEKAQAMLADTEVLVKQA